MNDIDEMIEEIFGDLGGQEYTRKQKAIMYVITILNDLCDKGLMEGNVFSVSEEGLKAIEDFKPTDEEIEGAILLLKQGGYIG